MNDNDDKPIATTIDNKSHNPIILPVVNPSREPEVLVFNVDDIKTLRNEYNILGVLMGHYSIIHNKIYFFLFPQANNMGSDLATSVQQSNFGRSINLS